TALRFAATLPQGERRKLASGLAEHGELQRRGGRFAPPPPQGGISAPPPQGQKSVPPQG
ncbi:MAG: transporter, partial [Acidiphilium sp. 37-67-22]